MGTNHVSVGDEISYRSVEGCTVAEVTATASDVVSTDNGKVVPRRLILEVFKQ